MIEEYNKYFAPSIKEIIRGTVIESISSHEKMDDSFFAILEKDTALIDGVVRKIEKHIIKEMNSAYKC